MVKVIAGERWGYYWGPSSTCATQIAGAAGDCVVSDRRLPPLAAAHRHWIMVLRQSRQVRHRGMAAPVDRHVPAYLLEFFPDSSMGAPFGVRADRQRECVQDDRYGYPLRGTLGLYCAWRLTLVGRWRRRSLRVWWMDFPARFISAFSP